MRKTYGQMNIAEKKAYEWEAENLVDKIGYYYPARLADIKVTVADAIAANGNDVFKISPKTTVKNGKLYRSVQGGITDIDRNGKPKMLFHSEGYVKDGRAKPGTHLIVSKSTLKSRGFTDSQLKQMGLK